MTSPPLAFAAAVVGVTRTNLDTDGWQGYAFGLTHADGSSGGCLVVQRADDPQPGEEPYCLVWGQLEGTTYGGVRAVRVSDGEVTFELERFNAAELGTPASFRVTFPPEHADEVRAGLRRTLGPEVVA